MTTKTLKIIQSDQSAATEMAGRQKATGQGYQIKNKGKGEAEVFLYDDIGDSWFGGISAKAFADDLKALGELNTLHVRINSEGGSVFDGIAIYNTLVSNSARVIVHIDSLAASIASIIAMAGDEIIMAENGWMMIHNPWGVFAGDANDLRQQADLMDKIRDQLLLTYSSRASLESDEISELMDAETWMTAQEAYDWGFADTLGETMKVAAHVDVKRFRNVPKALTEVKNVVQQSSEQADRDARVKVGEMAAFVASSKNK